MRTNQFVEDGTVAAAGGDVDDEDGIGKTVPTAAVVLVGMVAPSSKTCETLVVSADTVADDAL